MASREDMMRRQRMLAEFGEFVLDHDDLQKILDEACRLVAEALGGDLAKVIEIDADTNTGLVRAGVGWRAGIVGHERIDLAERSSEAYAIRTAEPLVTQDLAQENRFDFPRFLLEHGVVALVNVPILLPGRKPYGILQVDVCEPREFDQQDIEFLKTYAMVLGPVVDRLKTQSELRRTDERLRLIVNNARAYVMILSDAQDRITDWLGGSEAILGWSAAEAFGKTTDFIFTQEDRRAGMAERELQGARENGASANIRWHLRKDGTRVFLHGQTIALRNEDGTLRGYLKLGQDVTERKRNEERQSVLLAELQHRVRNVLAMMRSLVKRTAAPDMTAEEMREQLEGRIDALSRTQALLTRAVGGGVDLELLIRDELLAQAADLGRVSIVGPEVKFAPKAAEVLSLAVHELATNAVKYGALGPGGHLSVSWSLHEEGGRQWLRFTWDETRVSAITLAPRREGFGTELITRRVPYELGGRGRIEFRPGGIHCTIEFPLAAGESILETGSPA